MINVYILPRKNPNPEWLMGGNPRAIENQEAQGQIELCNSSQLPRTGWYDDIKKEYIKRGIKVIGISKYDDLFYDVELPKDWKIKPTDHSMWSELRNEKDIVIANIFYKAAFYDRNAHIDFK